MFDKSILTSWSGPGNEATVTVTFKNPIVFHKLVIVKKNGVDKVGLSFLTRTINQSLRQHGQSMIDSAGLKSE